MMVCKEARECVEKINANMNDVRHLVLDLYEREGWAALGYQNWRECVTAEFKQGERHLYEQLEAAQTERNICAIAQNIPESQLRPLTKLRNEPEKQKEAWQQAVETAPDGKVTAAHVQKVVREMMERVLFRPLTCTRGRFQGRGVLVFFCVKGQHRPSVGKRYG